MFVSKLALKAAVTVSLLSLCLGCTSCDLLSYDRDLAKQEAVARAYVEFYSQTNQFPSSVAQLISMGYLPDSVDFKGRIKPHYKIFGDGDSVHNLRALARIDS